MEHYEMVRETPSDSKEEENETNNPKDLSSPTPCQTKNEITKKKVFGITYLDNYFLLVISNIIDKYLSLELIPVEGILPYSYKVTYNMQILNSIDYLFKDLKTIDECMKRIISILQKKRISIFRDSENDLFYIVLKITIIDEDKYIPLKLSCTNIIQICTIRYIYNEITGLREKYNEYKKVKNEQLEKQKNEINKLKEKNQKYLKIIQKLKNKEDKDYQNKIKELNYKLENLEQKLIYHKLKFKCDIIPHHKIIIFYKKDSQNGFDIQIQIKNIGNSFLSTKYDKIYFEKDKNLSSKEIDLENNNNSVIKLKELLKPNEFIELNLNFRIYNTMTENIYNYYANIYSIKHGLLSSKPLIIQALIIPDNIKEVDLLKYLQTNFEINFKENNLYFYKDKKMKNIKYIDNKEIKNITTSIKEEKGNEYIYEYRDNDKEKRENKKGLNIDEEWRGFLANNKDVKINEIEVKKIIEKLNLEYFASLWLEHKKIFKIIIDNDGNYEKISKDVENLL